MMHLVAYLAIVLALLEKEGNNIKCFLYFRAGLLVCLFIKIYLSSDPPHKCVKCQCY